MKRQTAMTIQTFVSGDTGLSPLLDVAAGLFSRDGGWRTAFAEQIAPSPHDVIADVGCGDGALAVMLAHMAPRATIIGVDPDPAALARARDRAARAGVKVTFVQEYGRNADQAVPYAAPTKIVSSLVLHKISNAEKRALLEAARRALMPGGILHVADYGAQRTVLMQRLFRTLQALEGVENTDANARGALPAMIRAAGFEAVEETMSVSTVAGSISFFRARAA
jgi:16S rRNA G1207 methylase RsmC